MSEQSGMHGSLFPEPGPVTLRRLRPDDLDGFLAYRSDPVVARFQGWPVMSRADASAFIRDMATAAWFLPDVWAQLAVARRADDRLVGDVGIVVHSGEAIAELGFTIAPQYQRLGFGTAAARAAIDLLFHSSPVRRVIGVTDARNTPSVRVLERIGMRRIESREARFKGETCTEWVYARDR